MKILAISGSARLLSTNTALLRALRAIAPPDVTIDLFDRVGDLPVFSPDLEGEQTPVSVRQFTETIAASDGLIISSPEYVRSIPGGLKNAIDWLVSGDQIVGKPIVLAHASHRGEDILETLRTVLSTVSSNFNAEIFFRFPVMTMQPDEILEAIRAPAARQASAVFFSKFIEFCRTAQSKQVAGQSP